VAHPLLTVDVAHPPIPPEEVEQILLRAWSRVRNSSGYRLLKIIHGHGSTGKGGSTRELVRNWAFLHRSRFRAVINGEAYSIVEMATQEMRREVGQYPDADLDRCNRGITILWIK
jgi:hypothetical protein